MSESALLKNLIGVFQTPAAIDETKRLFEDASLEQFTKGLVMSALGKISILLSKQPELSGKDIHDNEYKSAFVASLQEFSNAVSHFVEQFVEEDGGLSAAVDAIEAVGTSKTQPVGSVIFRVGGLYVAPRTAGEPAGMAAGRTSGLLWIEVSQTSTEIPAQLQSVITNSEVINLQGIEYAALPFCRGGVLWHLWFPGLRGSSDGDAYIITLDSLTGQELYNVDWTNGLFYRLSEMRRFRFSSQPEAYIRCFFHLVRGQMGRFNILSTESDLEGPIRWRMDTENCDDHIAETKQKIRHYLIPITRKAFKASGEAVFRVCVLFKNAIFHTDVVVSPSGILELENEELKLEDLPIYVEDGLGRPEDEQSAAA